MIQILGSMLQSQDLGSRIYDPRSYRSQDLSLGSMVVLDLLYMDLRSLDNRSRTTMDPRDRSQDIGSRIIDPRSYVLGLYHGSQDLYHRIVDPMIQILGPRSISQDLGSIDLSQIDPIDLDPRTISQIYIMDRRSYDIDPRTQIYILGSRIYRSIKDRFYRSRSQDYIMDL